MRIQELDIDRFGIWQQVRVPLNASGLTVFYGPNGAGKSTLLRFIRGVLYGYQSRDQRMGGHGEVTATCSGSLKIEHGGRSHLLRRTAVPGSRGRLEIDGRQGPETDRQLEQILAGASESLFENIFAIGLHELQQLATLSGEEVAQHIYGLSLGPDGERILNALDELDAQERNLLDADSQSGELNGLLEQLESVDDQLARLPGPSERYLSVLARQQALEEEVEAAKGRQTTLQQNLRGQQFLHRVWGPWNRQRQLQDQLSNLLPNEKVTPQTLKRFDELESELGEQWRQRQRLIDESRQRLELAKQIKLRPEFEEHACEIRHLLQLSAELQALDAGSDSGRTNTDGSGTQLAELLSQLPGQWDVEKLEQSDVSPTTVQKLTVAAGRLREARRHQARLLRRYKRLSDKLQHRQHLWSEQSQQWKKESPAEIRRQAEKRIREIQHLHELRIHRDQLARTLKLLGDEHANEEIAPSVQTVPTSEAALPDVEQQSTPQPRRRMLQGIWQIASSWRSRPNADLQGGQKSALPPLFSVALWFFTVAGVCLTAAGGYAAARGYTGIVAGGPTAWIAGTCLFLLGISAIAISRALGQHSAVRTSDLSGIGKARKEVVQEIERLNLAVDRLTRKEALRPPLSDAIKRDGEAEVLSEQDVLNQIHAELAQLDAYEREGQWIQRTRRTLSRMRNSVRTRQQHVVQRRSEWCQSLREIGFEETLDVDGAVGWVHNLLRARVLYDQTHNTKPDSNGQFWDELHRRVNRLGEQLTGRSYSSTDLLADLAHWDRERQKQAELRRERLQLRHQARKQLREAGSLSRSIKKLRSRRAAFLAQRNVQSRAEIVAKLQTNERHKELSQQLEETRHELERIARSEPNLAIVEEDLLGFTPHAYEQAVAESNRGLEAIDAQLQELYEQLGDLKRQRREIEEDRSTASLRFERAQLLDALQQAAERWCTSRLAKAFIGKLRERVERTRQPELLRRAADFLQRLTCGKYTNVWVRLGERRLIIDDDCRQSLGLEQLSSGTREQVFLAIRMAMIRSLARQGSELPMVLDDVTVNFDHPRTEAAVNALLELAEEGQQVLLFTCHLHLAHMFQNKGIEPVWLPSLNRAAETEILQRRA